MGCVESLQKIATCPRCGSHKIHESVLHECPNGGTPMKCDSCYHTWCA